MTTVTTFTTVIAVTIKSDNRDKSDNGDNSDSSQVKMEVSLSLSECLLKQTICLYPETAKEKENARY